MRQVVAGGGGTGSRAENDYVPIVGKTGTGEWHPDKDQYVAWFAGFIPYKNPEYAYACLYEGDPGEDQISGGRKVAPIVADVFNEIYKAKKERGELKDSDAGDDDEHLVTTRTREPRAAKPVEEVRAVQPAPEPPMRGGLRWLFRRRTPQPPAPTPTPFQPGRPLR
jgi:penicillin-binding protein 2